LSHRLEAENSKIKQDGKRKEAKKERKKEKTK
jgi:hypothetical protein